MQVRSVETPHYHVWTDALRGRDLAQTAGNDWDRGTFVRWSILSAWTAFEEEVRSALHITYYGSAFWDKFDDALRGQGVQPPPRGQGIWQQMATVYKRRKEFAHLTTVDQSDLVLQSAEMAEHAIARIREAVKDLHLRLQTSLPDWISEDVLPQQLNPSQGGVFGHATLTVGKGGVRADDPGTIRTTHKYQDKEGTSYLLPPGTDPEPYMKEVIRTIRVPISRVRAYVGDKVLSEIKVRMRGSGD